MAVFVPQTGRRQDQVAFVHGAFLALHGGETAFAFHHKTHCAGRVTVVGGHFARQYQLHANVNVRGGHQLFNAVPWVAQHQHAALGFFDGRQFPGAHQLGANIFVMPNKGLSGTRWLAAR